VDIAHECSGSHCQKREGEQTVLAPIQRLASVAVLLAITLSFANIGSADETDQPKPWYGLHVIGTSSDAALDRLAEQIPGLAKMGINTLILEVNYGFEFQSHPELRSGRRPITKEGARKFADLCRAERVRLIPQFQCLGHQSWRGNTFPLLTEYTELDLTPGAFPDNKGLYCREWDPLNPKVNEIVFPLMDELIDAFAADALHVGMDEVFLIGSEQSPSTKDKDPAEVFAKAVNDYHEHLVNERGVEMLMWADRFIDGKATGYGKWEASEIGTHPAVDMVPKDIIMCDWHYNLRETYPSVPMFLEKGFRVWPAGWRKVDATKALINYSRAQNNPRMLGHLFTTWGAARRAGGDYREFPPLVEGLKLLHAEARR
jgi:hypothetical protein